MQENEKSKGTPHQTVVCTQETLLSVWVLRLFRNTRRKRVSEAQ